ncbi:hypothetical protein [Elizabethkingia meningoseptica]|uniref:hypothetical protein n=1 Tax=Elizabethkingia meningoseptica TaxID=238 RepID=UPI002DD67F78|nr:hypothetical protein [Elizabethkingia meningoseptica]MEC4712448.1 hypothetical protein [Elizabethkingia meningoseptica]
MRIILSLLILMFFISCVDSDYESNLDLPTKGSWAGTFKGDIDGSISFTSNQKGLIIGYIIPDKSEEKDEIGGGITRDGLVTFNSKTVYFQGFLSSDSKASGRWTMHKYSGTWTMNRYK